MDFSEILAEKQRKATTVLMVEEIVSASERMDELMTLFIEGPIQITQRAAWPLEYIAVHEPQLLVPYFKVLIDLLCDEQSSNTLRRNILRTFQFIMVPEEYQGQLLDVCFLLLNDPKQPIAFKAFGMTVIFNLSKLYPDILPELRASIEALLPHASAGKRHRGNKILKAIRNDFC